MIIIALGANLPSAIGGPIDTLEAAITALGRRPDVDVIRRSHWYKTSPVGLLEQPDFINGAAIIETPLRPSNLLECLLDLELKFGRRREGRWGPRLLDLDIVDFNGLCETIEKGGRHLYLPHPRAHERAFVLAPVREIAPKWRHPESGLTAAELLERVDSSQKMAKIDAK